MFLARWPFDLTLPRCVAQCQVLSGHKPQPKLDKFLLGVLLFIGLLIVILGPAMLFSTLNPTLDLNPIQSVQTQIGASMRSLANMLPRFVASFAVLVFTCGWFVGVHGKNCFHANLDCPAGSFTLFESNQFQALENATSDQFQCVLSLCAASCPVLVSNESTVGTATCNHMSRHC